MQTGLDISQGDRSARASIRHVARLAGVSPTTVSHVLSGKRPVGSATRRAVIAAMAELDYAPMRSAQNLALNKTQLIAALVPDVAHPFFAELVSGVERAASKLDYNVLVANTGFDRASGLNHLKMIRSRAVDGVLYAPGSPYTDSEIAHAVGGLPLVLMDQEVEGTRASIVISDNRGGAALAAEHLIELGHRQALLLSFEGRLVTSMDREKGFTDVWEALPGGELRVAHADSSIQGGCESVRQHLDALRAGEITAVFAVSDLMALGALRELRENGIPVPQAVSVIGFDDIAWAREAVPPLTTIRQDISELGAQAASLLLRIVANEAAPQDDRTTLPVELVVRETTGPILACWGSRSEAEKFSAPKGHHLVKSA